MHDYECNWRWRLHRWCWPSIMQCAIEITTLISWRRVGKNRDSCVSFTFDGIGDGAKWKIQWTSMRQASLINSDLNFALRRCYKQTGYSYQNKMFSVRQHVWVLFRVRVCARTTTLIYVPDRIRAVYAYKGELKHIGILVAMLTKASVTIAKKQFHSHTIANVRTQSQIRDDEATTKCSMRQCYVKRETVEWNK